MGDVTIFEDGYKMGARHAAELLESRLYYIPEDWKKGTESTVYNVVSHAIADIKRLYEEGVDYGKN